MSELKKEKRTKKERGAWWGESLSYPQGALSLTLIYNLITGHL